MHTDQAGNVLDAQSEHAADVVRHATNPSEYPEPSPPTSGSISPPVRYDENGKVIPDRPHVPKPIARGSIPIDARGILIDKGVDANGNRRIQIKQGGLATLTPDEKVVTTNSQAAAERFVEYYFGSRASNFAITSEGVAIDRSKVSEQELISCFPLHVQETYQEILRFGAERYGY